MWAERYQAEYEAKSERHRTARKRARENAVKRNERNAPAREQLIVEARSRLLADYAKRSDINPHFKASFWRFVEFNAQTGAANPDATLVYNATCLPLGPNSAALGTCPSRTGSKTACSLVFTRSAAPSAGTRPITDRPLRG